MSSRPFIGACGQVDLEFTLPPSGRGFLIGEIDGQRRVGPLGASFSLSRSSR
jgi:hypothetical protein